MPANFSNLRLLYSKPQLGQTETLVLNLSSINFDTNQVSIRPNSPFTSEMTFRLNFENHPQGSISDLNDLVNTFPNIDEISYEADIVELIREIFQTQTLALDFNNLAGDALIFSSAQLQRLVSLNTPGVTDLFDMGWELKLKFHSVYVPGTDVDTGGLLPPGDAPMVLYPQLAPRLGSANDGLSALQNDNTLGRFNDELRLNYEVQYLTALENEGPSTFVDTIGRATDELTDTLSNLTSSLNANLTSTFRTQLQPPGNYDTNDLALWVLIKKGTEALSFGNFMDYMDAIFCSPDHAGAAKERKAVKRLAATRSLPFMNIDAYRCIKIASEAFVMVNCMVDEIFTDDDVQDLASRVPLINGNFDKTRLEEWWASYKVKVTGADGTSVETLPYLAVIQNKLKDENIKMTPFGPAFQHYIEAGGGEAANTCFGILSEKLTHPCFLELIWSYWHEESMMVQGLNAISRRFQNVKGAGADPLANLELDPLRPLNNLLWGYVQDQQHRLSVRRRNYEYDHHYGITLRGEAVKNSNFADSRSRFIEAFHRLLNIASRFYRQADDMTVRADGFPVLNALREVHLVLSEGAHNQYGDLPSVSRMEMLMEQWLLARPEFREFLPGRIMVAYPEPWMDRVAAMNNMMGWTKANPLHFNNLAVFGEQLLLSIRFGNWTAINNPGFAANWANYWREQIQGYTHAYYAVTGVDLSSESRVVDVRQPSYHLYRQLIEQQRNRKTA
jgi:hypothetical protein